MRILFVHCNYPAQFRHLTKHLAADHKNEIVFLCQNREWIANDIPNLKPRYQLGRDPKGELCHPIAAIRNSCSSWTSSHREALRLRQDGFCPDVIIGHSGFGNALYLKRFGQTPNLLVISNGSIAARDPMWALARINPQALTPACVYIPTTAQ